MKYTKYTDLTPNSIEEWASLFDPSTSNCEPLRDRILNDFVETLFLQTAIESDPEKLDEIKASMTKGSTMDSLIISRMEYMDFYDFDPLAVHLLADISRSPGEAVMYIWIVAKVLKSHGSTRLTTHDVCQYICPFGRPKEDYMQQMWEMQKIDKDERLINMLDCIELGSSLNLK